MDLTSPRWEQRVAFAVSTLLEQNKQRALELQWQQQLAMIPLPAGLCNELQQLRSTTFAKILEILFPGEDFTPETILDVIARMRKKYVQRWGDPKSEAYQESLQKLLDHWKRMEVN